MNYDDILLVPLHFFDGGFSFWTDWLNNLFSFPAELLHIGSLAQAKQVASQSLHIIIIIILW